MIPLAAVIATELLLKLLFAMHDAESALHACLGRKTFATFTGDLEKTGCLDRMIDLPYGLRVEGCGCKTTTHKRRRKFGQDAGVCTRTVAFTTRSAAITPRS